MPATLLKKLTYEDLRHYPPDGKRHELIDGDHFVNPAPVPRHQELVIRLAYHFMHVTLGGNAGRVYTSPIDVVLSEFDVVEPDLVFLAEADLARIRDTHIDGPPNLVVEVLSPSTRKYDEITKRNLYERHGVDEYWVVDPDLEQVKIYRRQGGSFAPKIELTVGAGDVLATELVPGFELALADLFG